MIDATELMQKVAALAEDLEREYGSEAELGAALIAVEVLIPEDDGVGSIVEHRATVSSTAHVLGLAELVNDSLRSGYERGDDEDDAE